MKPNIVLPQSLYFVVLEHEELKPHQRSRKESPHRYEQKEKIPKHLKGTRYLLRSDYSFIHIETTQEGIFMGPKRRKDAIHCKVIIKINKSTVTAGLLGAIDPTIHLRLLRCW